MALLQTIRESAEKTQEDVSRDLGIGLQTVHRHESGKTPINGLQRLGYGAYYGVDPDTIEQPTTTKASRRR